MLRLDHRGGKLDVEKGLVKPKDRKAVAKAQPDSGKSDDTPDSRPGLPQSLVADLKAYRTQIAQVAFAENPAVAFDLLVFGAACDALSLASFVDDGPKVSFQNQFAKPSVEAENLASRQLDAIREALPLDWMKGKSEPEQFAAFRELPDADKHRILAYCAALTLQPKLAAAEGKQKTAYDAALALTGAIVADYWRPTAANFLNRVKREQLLEIGKAIHPGNAHWLAMFKDAKKAALVAELDETFALSGNPDTREAIKNWLPAGMEIAVAEPAAPAKAKKGRKAA